MPTELVNGIKICYDVRGDGPPVLLSHGYSATGRMWDGQLASFSDRYRMIAWDMRGHGQTESPDDPSRYSTDHTVADMKSLLAHLGVTRMP